MKHTTGIAMAALVCLGALLFAGCTSASAAPSSSSAAAPASSEVTSATSKAAPSQAAAQQVPNSDAYIGEEAAKTAALAHAGLDESDATFVHVHLDYDDGRWEYEVEFYSGSTEYDYDIDALTGEIVSFDQDAEYYSPGSGTQQGAAGEYIGEDEAKRIALEHAGLSESDVTALRVSFDMDDGRAEYEVEWYVGRTEYSYEIDATNGSVLGHEMDND